MHIIIDIDNTIADLTSGLKKRCRIDQGHALMEACFKQYDIFPTLHESHGPSYVKWARSLFSDRGFYSSLDPYYHAADTLEGISAAGAKITYCTARHKNLGGVTENWLGENGFPTGEIIYKRGKWLLLGDMLIDDCPEILRMSKHHLRNIFLGSLLHPYSHEHGYPADLYFSNWQGLDDILQAFTILLR